MVLWLIIILLLAVKVFGVKVNHGAVMNIKPGTDFRRVLAEDIDNILSAEFHWERFVGTKVLVTGANGMIASLLIEVLVALNKRRSVFCEVIALVRNDRKGRARFAHILEEENFSLLVQDVNTPLPESLRVDYIVHAASLASPRYCCSKPVDTILANTVGTNNLLSFASKTGVKKFVFVSSGEVYGKTDSSDGVILEDSMGVLDPLKLRSCYGESKRLGECLCMAYSEQYGVDAVSARLFHTYGPGMDLNDGRIFSSVIADVLAGRNILLHSAGTARRCFCYLSDTVTGLLLLMLCSEEGKAYNIGNEDEEYSVRELAEIVAGMRSGIEVECNVPEAGGSIPQPLVDRILPATGLLRSLGWRPVVKVFAGFERTLRAYEGMG